MGFAEAEPYTGCGKELLKEVSQISTVHLACSDLLHVGAIMGPLRLLKARSILTLSIS